MAEDTKITDTANYRKLSEPFGNVDQVNNAVLEFQKEMRELRKKYHIRDVHLVMSGSYLSEDGEEIDYALNCHHGDEHQAEYMLAWALGKVQAERQETVAKLHEQFLKAQRNRR